MSDRTVRRRRAAAWWMAGLALGLATVLAAACEDDTTPGGGGGGGGAGARGQPAGAIFNIRNFPEMPADPNAEPRPAPLGYQRRSSEGAVVGLLASLDFDLLAVQEIIDTELFDALVARLGAHTGRRHAAIFSRNDNGNPQHLGFVYDADALRLDDVAEHPEVDVRGTLRPALSARVRSRAEGGWIPA